MHIGESAEERPAELLSPLTDLFHGLVEGTAPFRFETPHGVGAVLLDIQFEPLETAFLCDARDDFVIAADRFP